jgi:uncharacterized protein
MTQAADWISATADYMQAQFSGESSGHDWWHTYRVWQMALRLAEAEGADTTVVALAALLHDVADWKFHDGDDTLGARQSRDWLSGLGVAADVIAQVTEIVVKVSFKGAGVADAPLSLAGQCVQDADRLDAIGAVGIGRAFAYGGAKGRLMHDPAEPPVLHTSFADYQHKQSSTLNHFYEKLLLLRDRLHTAEARRVAAERHAFMEAFVARFLLEWEGRA